MSIIDQNPHYIDPAPARRRRSADVRDALRQLHVNLVAQILTVKAPRAWIEPDADDVRDINTYMLAVANVCDQWAKQVGEIAGASKKDIEEYFAGVFVGALDGNATHVIEEIAREIERHPTRLD